MGDDEVEIERSKDRKGPFYRPRGGGKKAYYEPGNASSRQQAKELARKRARRRGSS